MSTPPFCIAYRNIAQSASVLANAQVMAAIGFGAHTQTNPADSRQFTVGLPELGGNQTLEVWYSRLPLQKGITGGIHWVGNQEVLLAHLLVEETAYPDLASATYAAYRQLLAFAHRQGYPCLLRIWNYFPAINRDDNGLERYQAFCQGRHQALATEPSSFESTLPAACALGSQTPGLLLYALAARQSGIQIENPRQLSAFRYPRRYGPKSPSFSRSILKSWGTGASHLYLSGTASIVGHLTRHHHDPIAQLHESLLNVETLLEQAGRRIQVPFRLALLKVYVRPTIDIARLHEPISERFGPELPLLFLQADICRRDLLVEIEGLGVSLDGSPPISS
ncbi:MAG: hypothetical protein U1F76_04645 [Candidatus Competibacteraceae bacterium]